MKTAKQSIDLGYKGTKKHLNLRTALISLCMFAFVGTSAQTGTVTVKLQNASVKELFSAIEKQTSYRFSYRDAEIKGKGNVTISATNRELKQLLEGELSKQGLKYAVSGNKIIVTPAAITTSAQPKKVTGKVVDANGEPVIGATIKEQGTTNGTITDFDGNFTLDVADNAMLEVSYIGYKSQELRVVSGKTLSVTLREDTEVLDEVVVVGYGVQKKANLTGAVGNVSMDDMDSRPLTSASLALQGTVSGVYALQNSGRPGDDSAIINIRGVGTLNNSEPLVLIDGFPGSMLDVSASDIKSISVLKDAASASIYGNRAANGVILITTKRGDTGKLSVSYNGYIGQQEATSLPDVLNSVQYAKLYNEAALNSGAQPRYSEEEIQKFAAHNDPLYPDVNYFDTYYGKASIQNHRLNVSGGTDNVKYAFMLGHLNQNGILVGTKYKKTDFRANIDSYFLKNKKLRFSTMLSGNWGRTEEPTDLWYAKWYATNAPVFGVKDEEGRWLAVNGERNYYGEIMEGATRKINRYAFNGQIEAEYEFFKGLSAVFTYGYNVTVSNTNAFHVNINLYNPNGSLAQKGISDLTVNNNLDTQTLLTALLKYDKRIKYHQINILAGYSEESFDWAWNSGYRSGFVNNSQRVLSLGDPSTQKNDAGANALGLRSFFGRINYKIADKYLLEANIRSDASSRFGAGNKWGTFPSFSAGWVVSEEQFMRGLNWLDMLKIRGSWGRLGNQNINSYYVASDILDSGQNYSLGGKLYSGAAVNSMSNKKTSWETTEQVNVGLDLSVFNSINISLDYFDKKTSDILMQIPIPITLGNLSAPYQNVGEVKNYGVEMSVNYNKSFSNGLKLNATFNASRIVNKITNLNGRSPIINGPKALVEGYAINSFYGYKVDGVYQISDFTWQNNSDSSIPHEQREYNLKEGIVSVSNYNAKPGDLKYKDLDGDGKVTMDGDRTVIGKQFPDWTYSLQLGARWKQFDMSLFFQGVAGMNGYTYNEIAMPFSGFSNLGSWWLERWTPENPSNKYPRVTLDSERRQIYSEFYMEDASYLRLKNIELGYSLSKKVCSWIGINSLRIYGNIQNAFTITKYKGFDPEQNVEETRAQAYPQVRIFTAGISVNF